MWYGKKHKHTATHCNTLQHTATHCNTNFLLQATFFEFLTNTAVTSHENFVRHVVFLKTLALFPPYLLSQSALFKFPAIAAITAHKLFDRHGVNFWRRCPCCVPIRHVRRMSHVTRECVMSHMNVSRHIECHMSHVNDSCHTCEWVMSHVHAFRPTGVHFQSVMSHIQMSHVTQINESCNTCDWVMSHIWMSHVTHMNAFMCAPI